MDYSAFLKYSALFFVFLFTSSCVVYTEKRSEALSQAVFAASESINQARFDLAHKYSEQAKRLAFPPKKPIEVSPIITSTTKSITSSSPSSTKIDTSKSPKTPASNITSNVINRTDESGEKETILRLVVPEFLRHAKLLIENSEEWNELLKTKEFATRLEQDHKNLQKLVADIDAELQKQMQMNEKMVKDLNVLQKKIVEKDLAIWHRNIVIAVLVLAIAAGIYLRIKGIL